MPFSYKLLETNNKYMKADREDCKNILHYVKKLDAVYMYFHFS